MWDTIMVFVEENMFIVILGFLILLLGIRKVYKNRKEKKKAAQGLQLDKEMNEKWKTMDQAKEKKTAMGEMANPPSPSKPTEEIKKQEFTVPFPSHQTEEPTMPSFKSEPKKDDIESIFKNISGASTKSDDEEILPKIERLGLMMKKTDMELDKHILVDLEELKQKLTKVKEDKKMIQDHGKELHVLFRKYEAREFQLNAMVMGMEEITQIIRKKQTDRGIVEDQRKRLE